MPLQAPPQRLASDAHCVRVPCGGPVTGQHVPTLPVVSHASHAPPHAALQQTPSVQTPEVHDTPEVQAFPFATLGTQMLPLHQLPVEQSVLAAQLGLHAVAPQTYGAHAFVTAAGHVGPFPGQFVALVWTPAVQLAARHCTVPAA